MPTAASPPYPSSDLSDQEWAILVPLLPPPKPGGRPRSVDLRVILDGIFHVLRSGCQWRLQIVERPGGCGGWMPEGQEPPVRPPGFQPLPHRWIVERTFAWIGRNRRMSKDYEFLPATGEAWVYRSMVRLMLKRLAHEQVQPAFHYRQVA